MTKGIFSLDKAKNVEIAVAITACPALAGRLFNEV